MIESLGKILRQIFRRKEASLPLSKEQEEMIINQWLVYQLRIVEAAQSDDPNKIFEVLISDQTLTAIQAHMDLVKQKLPSRVFQRYKENINRITAIRDEIIASGEVPISHNLYSEIERLRSINEKFLTIYDLSALAHRPGKRRE